MKFKQPRKLLSLIGSSYNIEGDKDIYISGLGVVNHIEEGYLCFAETVEYASLISDTKCRAIILSKHVYNLIDKSSSTTYVISDNPSKLFNTIIKNIYSANDAITFDFDKSNDNKISKHSIVSINSKIGNNCIIYPFVYIDSNVVIGNNVKLFSGVRIYNNTVIGNNVIIQSNSVIGSIPGWHYKDNDIHKNFRCVGSVRIEDNVFIGANVSIDKGLVEETLICSNVKIGNNVQIGHGVEIDENVVIISQSGLAGGVIVGKNSRLSGQSAVASNTILASNTTLHGKSAITKSVLTDGLILFGIPAEEINIYNRRTSYIKSLPRHVDDINSRLNIIEKSLGSPHAQLSSDVNLPWSNTKSYRTIFTKISNIISEQLSLDITSLNIDTNLNQFADSLDMTELVMAIEEEFNIEITDEESGEISTIRHIYKLIRKHQRKQMAELDVR